MVKKVFLLFFLFFFFALVFPLPVRAQVSLDYDVGPNLEDYVWPHSQHRWRTRITNNTPLSASGRLNATYEAGKYSSPVDQGDWVKEGGGLRYDYSLGPLSSITIDWFGTLNGSDSQCEPINDTTSRLRNNDSLVATEIGTVLASVYLTLRNQTADSITVSTYVNGAFNDTRSLSPGGSSGFRITAGGLDNGGSLFSCSRPFSYSFTVTGVAGATYSCSVPSTALTNNCTSEHTATCTKTTGPTTGPTPTLPPGVPSPTPAPPTPPPPVGCDFSACGAFGCGSKQRWVSGNCWSYSWFGGDGCYNDDSCSVPTDCKPKYCHLLVDSQSGFECGEDFNSWKPGGSASQTDDRYDHGVQTGQWSLRVRYTGAADTPYYSAYTVVPSAPSSSQQAWFHGKYSVELKEPANATLKACVQYFSNWPNGYLGEDCVGLNASPSGYRDFEIYSPYRLGANQVLPKFDVAGFPGKITYRADSLCLQFVSGPTPTPTPPGNYTIAGRVTDVTKTKGIAGVQLEVYDSTVNGYRYPFTDSNGYWSVTDLIRKDHFYAVRVIGNQLFPQTAPLGYLPPAKTNEAGWNWNYCRNPNPGTFPWEDTPLGSPSYECQKAGTGIDCAGPNGARVSERCSFSYDSSKSCNATCTLDSECASNYCYPWSFLLSACRNKSCPDDLDCVCPIPTPTLTPVPPIPTPTSIPTPTPIPVPSWFQTTGGDIQAQDDITSLIPACATTSRYLSQNGEGGTSGVVGYGDNLYIGDKGGEVSINSWRAKTTSAGQNTGFEYLANRLGVDRTDNLGIGDIDISSLTDGVYYSSESLESRNIVGSFPDGKKIVIYIEGTANIRSNLVVPAESFLAIIASEDLTFSSAVIQAQGFFLAGGTLSVEAGSNQFEGQGSFVGLDGISINRDLGGGLANCTPAEAFVERPDFFINAPDEFKLTNSYFKEIEP